jgi:hypothetical protein
MKIFYKDNSMLKIYNCKNCGRKYNDFIVKN